MDQKGINLKSNFIVFCNNLSIIKKYTKKIVIKIEWQ